MDWTIRKLIPWMSDYLEAKGVESARLDAELLLAHALHLKRVQLYLDFDKPLQASELSWLKVLLQRRAGREALAYILGEKEFYGLNFEVNASVLIPRPETELIVEQGLTHLKSQNQPQLLDLGTGSGCILLSLLKNCPQARGLGLDLSAEALKVAERNAQRQGLSERCILRQHDLRGGLRLGERYTLITANLPYVSEGEYAELMPEVRDFEPRSALVPGPSGLEAFVWVLPELAEHLSDSGIALFEIGAGQAQDFAELAERHAPKFELQILQDLQQHPRMAMLTWK